MAHEINKTTILIDMRTDNRTPSEQSADVHKQACMHFYHNETGLQRDQGGTMLGGNMMHKYHVKSVGKGLWIVSKFSVLSPQQTRVMAMQYVDKHSQA